MSLASHLKNRTIVVSDGLGGKSEWENLRRANAILPAGQVTPSDKPYTKGGTPEEIVPSSDWTTNMIKTTAYAQMLARNLMGVALQIKITKAGNNFMMCYCRETHQLTLNLNGGCTEKFFANVGSVEQDDILLHEFGHEYESNHLDENYYRSLTLLGAKLKVLALKKPELFK